MVATPDKTPPHDCLESASGGAHVMTCMEVWGGNREVDSAVSTPGLDVWVLSRPFSGDAQGGDIHYVSMCAAGAISRFALADVAGHGQRVAALAGSLRSLMRKNINTVDQSRFTRSLNEAMTDSAAGRFATAVLATYFAPSSHLILTNAGHPRPLWFRKKHEGSGWVLLDEQAPGALLGHDTQAAKGMPANLPLGVIQPTSYSQFAVQLVPGDYVLIYSDALIESVGPHGMLGEQGLRELVQTLPSDDPTAMIRALWKRIVDRAGENLDDDVTMMLLHANGAPARPIPLSERISAVARLLGFKG